MITYENLQRLEKSCLELLRGTSGIAEYQSTLKSHEKLYGAIRKIIIANEMMGRGVICVSGLQGAGKTTLMKNFYGIDENIMNISLGRGEKLPIFISEKKNCQKEELYAVCLNESENGYQREYKRLTPEQFKLASMGDKTEFDVMYLELKVPYKHFFNESFTFMLLPGFERKNDYWQSLIDFSVKCSDTAIFVFNESSFASYDNQSLLDRIHKKFGKNLVYAISHSDVSRDQNQEVKRTCMKVMEIPDGEEDRVICAGTYKDTVCNDKWIAELKNAIEKYYVGVETANKNCNDYIQEIVEYEIKPELDTLKGFVDTSEGDVICLRLENSFILDAFDKIIKERKKQLREQIEDEFNKSLSKSITKLERLFNDKDYAKSQNLIEKRTRKFQRAIFGDNVKDIAYTRKRIEAAMTSEEGYYECQKAFVDAVLKTTKIVGSKNVCQKLFLENKSSQISLFEKSVIGKGYNEEKVKNVLHDVSLMLAENSEPSEVFYNQNNAETMKVIAELGVQYFGLATLAEVKAKNANLPLSDVETENLRMDYSGIKKGISTIDKAFFGTLGIAGIDLIEDGAINALPKIADALGVSTWIAGTGIAAITLASIVSDLNRIQRTEYVYAENAIISTQEKIKNQYLDTFDSSMKKLRDRIEENLIEKTGVNKKIVKKMNAVLAINQIEDELDLILDDIMRKKYDIRGAFEG